jgi:hypothetical protein
MFLKIRFMKLSKLQRINSFLKQEKNKLIESNNKIEK